MVILAKVPPLVLLAAGKSTRMGCPKGLLPFGERLWLEEQILRFKRGGGTTVTIVLGHDVDKYLANLPWMNAALGAEFALHDVAVRVTINCHYERGAFSSLHAALTSPWLKTSHTCLVQPIDVPLPSAALCAQLIMQQQEGHMQAVIPAFRQQKGHPVLLAGAVLEGLRRLDPREQHARLDHVINHLPTTAVSIVPCQESGVVLNLNTPDQWREFVEAGW